MANMIYMYHVSVSRLRVEDAMGNGRYKALLYPLALWGFLLNGDALAAGNYYPLRCLKDMFPFASPEQAPPEVWRYCQANWNSEVISQFNKKRISEDVDVRDIVPDSISEIVGHIYKEMDNLDYERRKLVDFERYFKFQLVYLYADRFPVEFKKTALSGKERIVEKLHDVLKKDTVLLKRKGTLSSFLISFEPTSYLVTADLSDVTAENLIDSDLARVQRVHGIDMSSLPGNYGFVAHPSELPSLYYLSGYMSLMNDWRERSLNYWGRGKSEEKNKAVTIYLGDDTLNLSSCEIPKKIEAIYCHNDRSVFVRSRPPGTKADTSAFHLMSPQAFHEIAHAFLNPSGAHEKPFLSEAIATAQGERAMRLLSAAEQAMRGTQKQIDTTKAHLNTIASVMSGASIPQSETDIVQEFIRQKMKSVPLTITETRMLCTFSQQQTTGKQLFKYLTLSSHSFNALPADQSQHAYALAWAIGYFGHFGEQTSIDPTIDLSIVNEIADEILANTVKRDARIADLDGVVEKIKIKSMELIKSRKITCGKA